jgi:polygalacturonase
MIFNVKDFGAIGDGHHDDSDAFQRALDSMVPKVGVLKDAKGGGVLLVPEGNYYLTKTLWISHRVEILGITGAEGENLINYTYP